MDDEEEEEEETHEQIQKQKTEEPYQPQPVHNTNKRIRREITPEKATLPSYKENEERRPARSNQVGISNPERHERVQNMSKSKPKITSAKSKPFDVRDTPKKQKDYATPNPKKKVSNQPEERGATRTHVKSSFASESERSSHNQRQRAPNFEEEEPKLLSNTHVFEHTPGNIEAVSNDQARKSMNNLHLLKEQKKKKLMQERSEQSASKMSTKDHTRQSMKPPLNNSSSQSSLSNMAGVMDLGNKKKAPQSVMRNQEEKRHETIVVQKQQKTKPLIGKANSNIIKRHETMNSFGEEDSLDPTLTANTIVPQRLQGSESEASSKD